MFISEAVGNFANDRFTASTMALTIEVGSLYFAKLAAVKPPLTVLQYFVFPILT